MDDRLPRLLVRHGLSERAARAAVEVGARLRARTQRHGVKFAALLDADSGELRGGIARGTDNEVTAAHIGHMRAGHEYLAVHTHPSSAAFSHADAALFVPFSQLRALAVVGTNGTWYLLSIPPTRPRRDFAGLDQAVAVEFVVLRPTYVARRDAGELTSAEVLKAAVHQAWLNVSVRFDVRDDRGDPT